MESLKTIPFEDDDEVGPHPRGSPMNSFFELYVKMFTPFRTSCRRFGP
jgi:hypothetical protein